MNNNQSLKGSLISSVSTDTVISHDVSEEFVLPDYVPEVRRVLFTRAQVLPESKYVADSPNGATLDFGGTVTYSVIYIDDEGKLCSAPLCTSYECSATLKGSPSTVFVDTVCDSATTRVSAPRRLTIKSRLKSRILGVQTIELCERIAGKSSADELFIERLTSEVSTFSVAAGTLGGIKMSEKLDTPTSQVRVALCDAYVALKEIKAINGGVSCHGEVVVRCVCESEGEMITLSKSMPLYENVELEGASQSDTARAIARCVSLSIFNEESDGACELCFEVSCEIEAEVYRNNTSPLLLDLYSTKNEVEVTKSECDVFTLIGGDCAPFSINEAVKRKSKEMVQIVDVILDTVWDKCDLGGSVARFGGRLCTCVIGTSKPRDDGGVEYLCEYYEIPIKYEHQLCEPTASPISRCAFSATLTDVRLSDDKLHISVQICPSVCVLSKTRLEIVESASLLRDTTFKKDASCVRVYFPKADDTLWNVAKKYHTTMRKIIDDNSLDGESLDGVKSIII